MARSVLLAALSIGSALAAHDVVVHEEMRADALEQVTGKLRGSRAFPSDMSEAPPAAIADQPDGTAEDGIEVALASQGGGHEGRGCGHDLAQATWAASFARVLVTVLRPVNMIKLCVASAAIYVLCAFRKRAHQKAEAQLTMTDRGMVVPLAKGEDDQRAVDEDRSVDFELLCEFEDVVLNEDTLGAQSSIPVEGTQTRVLPFADYLSVVEAARERRRRKLDELLGAALQQPRPQGVACLEAFRRIADEYIETQGRNAAALVQGSSWLDAREVRLALRQYHPDKNAGPLVEEVAKVLTQRL